MVGKWIESWQESAVIPQAEKGYAELIETEAVEFHAGQAKDDVREGCWESMKVLEMPLGEFTRRTFYRSVSPHNPNQSREVV